jgi:hypothetical protein
MIDVRSDRGFSGHGSARSSAGIDRFELSNEAGIAWIEQIRFVPGWAVKNLDQQFAQRALKDVVAAVHGILPSIR